MTSSDMVRYYAQRALEYEQIYQRPERQPDLRELKLAIEAAFVGRRVLDVACGTGYFSECAARRAHSLLGIDANEETLAIARSKGLANVRFEVGDAYALPVAADRHSGCLITFWWSHIPRSRIAEFLGGVQARLEPGSPVFIADNTFVPGNSTPISRTDETGNTYQVRRLQSGASYEVMKNFPTSEELRGWGERFGTHVQVQALTYFWALSYRSR